MRKRKFKISRELTVGPQLDESQLEDLARQGFKVIVNLSKRGELDQPLTPSEEGEKVAELGMHYVHHPVSIKTMRTDDVDVIREQVKDLEGPVYVHCRIGQRSKLFGMLLHGIRKGLSARRLFTKARKVGIEWNAPLFETFVENYMDQHAKRA